VSAWYKQSFVYNGTSGNQAALTSVRNRAVHRANTSIIGGVLDLTESTPEPRADLVIRVDRRDSRRAARRFIERHYPFIFVREVECHD
jgi:hypothetical protein